MKVLHLLPHVDNRGNGVVNAGIDLAVEQAVAGDEVAILSGPGRYAGLLDRMGIHRFDQASTMAGRFRQLRPLARRWGADVVHAHSSSWALLARLALGRTVPLVATAHNGFRPRSWPVLLADRVIAVGGRPRTHPLSRARWIIGVPNGVIGSRRNPERAPDQPALRQPAVVCVAGLYEHKGIDTVLRAFHEVNRRTPAQLYLVGEGPDRLRFEDLAEELGLGEVVHFVGFSPDPRAYMAAASVVVLASRSEAFGLVLAEARGCGTPVVATAVGGVPMVLDEGCAGILVPPEDSCALADAIITLVSDPERREYWARAASSNLDWLTVARMARDTAEVYRSIIPPRT